MHVSNMQVFKLKPNSKVFSSIKLHLTLHWVESFSARTRSTPTAIYARMQQLPTKYDYERKDTMERTLPTVSAAEEAHLAIGKLDRITLSKLSRVLVVTTMVDTYQVGC